MQPDQAIQALRERLVIPQEIDELPFTSLVALLNDSCRHVPDKPAFTSLGHSISYRELSQLSDAFAVYLQRHTDLQPGDRIAVQLPNLAQFPVVFYGALKAGLVVVNTNPLYTDRELKHQFNDAGVKALVVVANVAHAVQDVLPRTGIRHVIVTEVADLHGPLSRMVINFAARYIKKKVPGYRIPSSVSLTACLKKGQKGVLEAPEINIDDLALLQYTGGTTGLAKGAMLSHRNLLSNVMQSRAMFDTFKHFVRDTQTIVLPLPLYHVYACTLSAVMVSMGNHCLLIPDPRDMASMVKAIRNSNFGCFCGLNTLFVALSSREDFRALDFSSLRITISGGMALTTDAARVWREITGVDVYEGYGLTETSPVVSINTGNPEQQGRKLGSIGVPLPSTQLKVVDQDGNSLACGEAGELCVKGPQVMQGYWQLPEKTDEVLSDDGWLFTGDIAIIDEDGFPRIVDRKKDMIIVSGFNVYPNEVEDVISGHDQIIECAAIGMPDARAGEAIRLFAVRSEESLSADAVIAYARTELAAYKVPDSVEFLDELPKSNVGKILRRELRDAMLDNNA